MYVHSFHMFILHYFSLLFQSKVLTQIIYFSYCEVMVTHLTTIVSLYHRPEDVQSTDQNIL